MSELSKDYLTGLLNRQGLYEWYDEMDKDRTLHFMFMDLDHFKSVNDTYGHNVGDELLKNVAWILEECVPDGIIARLGGDEFVVVQEGACSRERLAATATEIIRHIRRKKGFEHIYTDLSASIGILHNEKSDKPLNKILFEIDSAMYAAKNKGRSCYVVFNDIEKKVYDQATMEKRQVEALQKGEFEIRYVPVLGAQTSRLIISETRMVWKTPDGRCRRQEEFLSLMEKNGFVRTLNLWLLEEICQHLQTYHGMGPGTGNIGVRISRLLLAEQGLSGLLNEVLTRYGVQPHELYLGISEESFGRGGEHLAAQLAALKKQGFRLALVDVGRNFASLRYWDKLELDYIRLDKEYLREAMSTAKGRRVVKTLFSMGRDLKVRVGADGVTNREDMLFLRNCGCNAISGSYYADPMGAAEYWEYAKERIVTEEQRIVFPFLEHFNSAENICVGHILGKGVELVPGISEKWGGVYFPGGIAMENVLELPASILAEESYTIGLWMKPKSLSAWSSVIYGRYIGGFTSLVPDAGGGMSVFRVSEDADAHGFHDILSRSLPADRWTFVCVTHDATSGVVRNYINGRITGSMEDVPLMVGCKRLIIGGDHFQASYHGVVSGLTFYDNVKSEEEIENWYQEFVQEPGFAGETETFWNE